MWTHRQQRIQLPHFRFRRFHYYFHDLNRCYPWPHTAAPQSPNQKCGHDLFSITHSITYSAIDVELIKAYILRYDYFPCLWHKYTVPISPFVSNQDTHLWFLGNFSLPFFFWRKYIRHTSKYSYFWNMRCPLVYHFKCGYCVSVWFSKNSISNVTRCVIASAHNEDRIPELSLCNIKKSAIDRH